MSRLPAGFAARPFAHRGLHDRAAGVIENSLPAIRAAAAGGYAVEIDVQLSSDGEAMVFHDYELDRLTAETGPVRMRDAAALGAIALRDGGGARIPTLAEALAALSGALAVVEVKRQDDPAPLCAATARALAAHDGPAAMMSFDPRAVAWFRDHAPDVPRGLVAYAFDHPEDAAGLTPEQIAALADMESFEALGADFFSYGAKDLPRARVAALRAKGVPALCWTIRSQAAAEEALRHVDAITFEGFTPAAR